MTDRGVWKGRPGLLAGVTVVVVVIVALVGEAAVRSRERHRPGLAGTMPLLFYEHGQLGHALVRDFDYAGRIHINREGFRGPEVAMQKVPGVLRIMVIGSSTTFDPGVSGDAATWPARLQFWLAQLAPSRGVEVINAGVPGYAVMTDLFRLETELYRYGPDVIVLYEGHNDLFGALRSGREDPGPWTSTPGEVPVVTPWGHWLSRHSLLYGKLAGRLKVLQFEAAGRRALVGARAAGHLDDDIIDTGAQRFERDLACFLAVAQSLGMRVVMAALVHASGVGTRSEGDSALLQTWSYTVPFAKPETVLRGYVRFNTVLEGVARRLDATWVPTASFGLAGAEWYEAGDPIHFNDRGADRMGRRMGEALLASRVLGVGAPRAQPIAHGASGSPPGAYR